MIGRVSSLALFPVSLLVAAGCTPTRDPQSAVMLIKTTRDRSRTHYERARKKQSVVVARIKEKLQILRSESKSISHASTFRPCPDLIDNHMKVAKLFQVLKSTLRAPGAGAIGRTRAVQNGLDTLRGFMDQILEQTRDCAARANRAVSAPVVEYSRQLYGLARVVADLDEIYVDEIESGCWCCKPVWKTVMDWATINKVAYRSRELRKSKRALEIKTWPQGGIFFSFFFSMEDDKQTLVIVAYNVDPRSAESNWQQAVFRKYGIAELGRQLDDALKCGGKKCIDFACSFGAPERRER